uniref:Acyl transferase domain-containing protein n=1 Tax=Candidatus Kentrum sp. DK TaxID=2126562 RepID=A0A450RV66_9GAMM|nr:MAG: Acyl transferase domain-containing protein [Candidatus Kentron sp. DK]
MIDDTQQDLKDLTPLQRAVVALKRKQAELDAIRSAQTEPVAIIGMGCRFPGADNPEAYWRLLRDGVDAVTEVPPDRWNIDDFYDPDPEAPGKLYTRHGAFLSEVDRFDPRFFGISAREAADMDPQQRLILEVAWEALENAGQAAEKLVDRPVGIFIGQMMTDYESMMSAGHPEDITAYTGTGGNASFVAGRLSYALGLQGPSLAVNTTCSSSLTAIHLACQSLRSGESEMALAGGVQVNVFPNSAIFMSKVLALSPDGRCKTFDASADGIARGEGCGVVVLKRLSKALADGDNVLALVRGSAIAHDGPSSGLSVPNRLSQEKVIRQALDNAGIKPEEVGYVEAHGTGTSLGDPIEMRALGVVFGKTHSKDSPLTVGSVKTNFGHTEGAAGIAGLMKIVLSLQYEAIPPQLHFKTPNPLIDWENLPFRIPVALESWPRGQGDAPRPRIAGVSSFGMSGTNAHVVLEEAPAAPEAAPVDAERPFHLLTLSAKDEKALRELTESFAAHLEAHPEVPLADICFTAGAGRSHFEHRAAVAASSPEDAIARLRAGNTITGRIGLEKPNTAFLFTGQGSQYPGMGRGLYETEPLFRETLDRCGEILRPLDVPLLDLLYGEGANPEALNQTIHTQPALFSLEYALARLWQSWGIRPDAVMGHSVGEYVAACIAGVFSPEDALKLIAARGRLMQTLCEPGAMLALQTTEAEALALIAPFGEALSLAAINGPESVVVSGEPAAMAALKGSLAERDVKVKALSVSHAFHSGMMEPMLAEFEKVAGSIAYAEPKIALCSNVTGHLVAAGEVTNPAYWVRHVREPVRFAAGVATLQEEGIDTFLEIGPKPALLGMARECLPDDADGARIGWLPSLREGQDDFPQLLRSLGEWYTRGGEINWRTFGDGTRRRKVPLPTYPFQRSRYWLDKARLGRRGATGHARSEHPLLGHRLPLSVTENTYFQSELDPVSMPWLIEHLVFDAAVFPATGYLEMALAAGARVFRDSEGGADAGTPRAVPLRITNVAIDQPLVLPEEETATCQLVLTPQEEGYGFQVSSLDAGEQWIAHVTGTLAAAPERESPETVDLAALRAQCPTEVSITDHYRTCRERGVDYGPAFQGIHRIFLGEDIALGELELPEPLAKDADRYQLHPALLDTALQTLLALAGGGEEMYLPVAFGELHLYRPAGNRLRSLARIVERDEKTLTSQLSLFDDAGVPVAEIKRITARYADPETLRRHFKKQSDDLYEIAWRASDHEAGGAPPERESGGWLILADRGGLGEELAARLEEAGNRCVLAYAHPIEEGQARGAAPAIADTPWRIDPTDPAAFQRLFRESFPPDALPLVGIVYLWALDAPESSALTPQILVESQHLVCGGALHLTQAMAERESIAKLWLVTRNAVAVAPDSASLSVAQGTLWGMGRTIAVEHPALWGGLIDNPTADDLLRETGLGLDQGRKGFQQEDQVAYRAGKRYVARLVKGKLPSDSRPSPRADASYLITGGLGGLGLAVARSMVAEGARNLILIGRRGPSEEAKQILRELEEAGASVLVASADVASEARMAALFREIAEQMPPLAGIIHTAGVLDDGMLREQGLARFDTVMAPKMIGGWLLHTLSRDLPLDFFVCFSSMASVLGSMGQSNYASANAFLDMLAHHRHALGLPGLAINWGAWSGVGMAANLDQRDRERLAAMGLDTLSPEQGTSILGRLMGNPESTRVGVAIADWSRFLKRFPEAPGFFSELARVVPKQASVSFLEEVGALPPEEKRDYVFSYLQSELNAVLGFEPTQPMDPGKGFSDMGMDSLMIVESRNRLQTGLKRQLSSTLLFDYPTPERLAGYIADEILGLESPKVSDSAAGRAKAASEALWDELDGLSDSELERLLDEDILPPAGG